MLILDKPRALDRMVNLSDRATRFVPSEFMRASRPLRWIAPSEGRRALAGEVVLGPALRATAPERSAADIRIESLAA